MLRIRAHFVNFLFSYIQTCFLLFCNFAEKLIVVFLLNGFPYVWESIGSKNEARLSYSLEKLRLSLFLLRCQVSVSPAAYTKTQKAETITWS